MKLAPLWQRFSQLVLEIWWQSNNEFSAPITTDGTAFLFQGPNMPQQFCSVDYIHLLQRMTWCPETHLKEVNRMTQPDAQPQTADDLAAALTSKRLQFAEALTCQLHIMVDARLTFAL